VTAVAGQRSSTGEQVKFTAWPGFEVPDLAEVVVGVRAGAPVDEELDALYYDTRDLRLVRSGVTVRCRAGDRGAVWTVKFPSGVDGGRRRREVDVVLDAGPPPAEVVSLSRAYLRTGELVDVARLQTRRRRIELLDGDRLLAEVKDDEVSVLDGDHVAARFREVEIDVLPGSPESLLDAIVTRVRQAGVGPPDPTPKLVRALGPRALQPADLVEIALGPSPTVRELVQASLTSSVLRIIDNDPVVRFDEDPEGVHQARVGARRLRSDLETFRPLLAGDWPDPLRDELRWIGQVLGHVRDIDVLGGRLLGEVEAMTREVDRSAGRALVRRLAEERVAAQSELTDALGSDRYAVLLDDLVAATLDPPLSAQAEGKPAKALRPLVSKAYRNLVKSVDRLPDDPTDEHLHEVRKRSKRARYAAEATAPVLGRRARRLARRLRTLQEVLGDHQDAVHAELWLRETASDAPPEQAMTAGLLISRARALGGRRRDAWPAAWAKVSTPKTTEWLR
jgi:CHAD domain-containing protein